MISNLITLFNQFLTIQPKLKHVDRVLYTPERLAAIAKEAAKPEGSIFTFEDRIGLINDAPALAKAGLIKVSSVLTLIENFRNETECTFLSCLIC